MIAYNSYHQQLIDNVIFWENLSMLMNGIAFIAILVAMASIIWANR